MDWIYISPHLDDVALSCGGLVWEQSHQGEVISIWTVCAGDPPPLPLSPLAESLHSRWQTGPAAVTERRLEDIAACQELAASYRHLSVPDCIYRRSPQDGEALYATEEAIFGALHPADTRLVGELSSWLASDLPRQAVLVCPLAVGRHVDHLLTRAAVERLVQVNAFESQWFLCYYADFPYAQNRDSRASLPIGPGWDVQTYSVSDPGLLAWGRAIAAYASQISTFWSDSGAMQIALRDYARQEGGVRLWRRILS
jgi:LmbE family N-acetylglucosaminyl deacetylase